MPKDHSGTKRGNTIERHTKCSVQSVQLRERKNGFLAPKRHQVKHLDFSIWLFGTRCSQMIRQPTTRLTFQQSANSGGPFSGGDHQSHLCAKLVPNYERPTWVHGINADSVDPESCRSIASVTRPNRRRRLAGAPARHRNEDRERGGKNSLRSPNPRIIMPLSL